MRTFAWTDYHYNTPSWPKRTQTVNFASLTHGLLVTRDAVVCQMDFPGPAVGNISWAYHYMRDDVRPRGLMSLLPYRRTLISVDQKNQKLLLALRVKRQARTNIEDREYVFDTFDDLRPYISYALREIVDPSTLSLEASFKPVVVRSYRAKTDFFQFSVNDALAACAREAVHGA